MEASSSTVKPPRGRLAVLCGGFALLSVAGCGLAETSEGSSTAEATLESTEAAITGGWTNLTLTNGWSAANGSTPSVGKVNGVVTFRGAIKGTPTAGDAPFTLPAAFRPNNTIGNGWDSVQLRVSMSGNASGTLRFLLNSIAGTYETHLIQDGLSGPGAAARTLTSLDGVSVDLTGTGATELAPVGWQGVYSFRGQGPEPAATAKIVNGFVRLQGFLEICCERNPDFNFMLTLPPQFRPDQPIYVPAALGFLSTGTGYGRLNIDPSGEVWVQIENFSMALANAGTSLEGVSYAISTSGTTGLSLVNGWAPYSSRAVRVRNDGGVIRLQGAVSGGTATKVTQLPVGMRPPRTIYVVADALNTHHARVIIDSMGNVNVDASLLSIATGFLSLDGVSFGI